MRFKKITCVVLRLDLFREVEADTKIVLRLIWRARRICEEGKRVKGLERLGYERNDGWMVAWLDG